ncbi:hypothetical protein RCL1_002793 [Eukaryota sp. TZLM3-RCL]
MLISTIADTYVKYDQKSQFIQNCQELGMNHVFEPDIYAAFYTKADIVSAPCVYVQFISNKPTLFSLLKRNSNYWLTRVLVVPPRTPSRGDTASPKEAPVPAPMEPGTPLPPSQGSPSSAPEEQQGSSNPSRVQSPSVSLPSPGNEDDPHLP